MIAVNQDEIVALGNSLRRIHQKFLKPGQESGSNRVWFQGDEPYFDVFLDVKEDQITWFQFTLRGKSLSWSCCHASPQTGATNDLDPLDGSYFASSKTVQDDAEVDQEFLTLVKKILQTRKDEPLLQQLSMQLEQH